MKHTLLLSLLTLSQLHAQTVTIDGSNNWNTGYRVEIDVENNGANAADGWVVVLNLGAGQTPSSISESSLYQPFSDPGNGIFAFTNLDYNAVIDPGSSRKFGFNVDPDNGTDPPTQAEQVTLNFEPGAQPALSIGDATILEGDSGTQDVTLTVTLNPAATDAVSVDYATVNGTATAGDDFTAASGTLDFAAGDTEKMITLSLLGDLDDEGNESFTVELSNATGALITDSSATVNITENDVVPDLAIADASAFENGNGEMQFTVTLTPPSASVVSVDYATGGGNATAGSDYIATSGTLNFSPGTASQTFIVQILDDSLEEFPESFQVTLSNAINADLPDPTANGNILDDERSGNGKPQTGPFNYANVLQMSMYFYEAQRSGKLPETNRVAWRGDSGLDDGSDVNRDLEGGWHDAGDHVKFGFPMANSAAILAWGGLEFRDAYLETGQYNYLLENLKWACDYFLKCHEVDAQGETTQFWGQVASGGIDHAYWGAPEVNPQVRTSFKIDRANPGTDLACETAAALASCSMLFRPTDPDYADELLENARQLYAFGEAYLGVYSESITDAAGFYRSFSGYEDERLWGALWLYLATGESAYFTDANARFAERFPAGSVTADIRTTVKLDFGPSWDDKNYGNLLLMAQILQDEPGKANAVNEQAAPLFRAWIDQWVNVPASGGIVTETAGGLRWLLQWGCLRYAANTAFHGLIYSKNFTEDAAAIQEFAEKQLNYILGDNPQGVSYVIGHGADFPTHPHHRSAHGGWANSGPEEDANGDQFPSRNILYGGLVGGPITAADDGWIPWRYKRDGSSQAFQANEVATDYNAGFTGCLARLYELYGGSPDPDFPPEATIPAGTEMFVTAAVTSDESRFHQIRFLVNNRSYAPARAGQNLAFRYYMDLSELTAAGLGPNDVVIDFNPINNGGSGGTPPTITSILPHDPNQGIYYVEIDLGGQNPLPTGRSQSRVEVQIRFGLSNTASGTIWNPDNDFSFQNISTGASNTTYSGFIPTYQNGQLVDGMVPDGDDVTPPPAFQLWQEATFTPAERADPAISGPLADPDGDGHLNIVEYAFNLNAKSADNSPFFEMSLSTSTSEATFRYPFNPEATDVAVTVEGSSNLTNPSWSDLNLTELPGSTQTMKEISASFNGTLDRYFFRMKVEQQ